MFSIRPVISSVLLLIDRLFKALVNSSSFEALERELQEAGQEFLGQLLTTILEAVDIRLMNQRDRERLRAVGKRQRELISLAGRITINRRLYRDQKNRPVRISPGPTSWSNPPCQTNTQRRKGMPVSGDH